MSAADAVLATTASLAAGAAIELRGLYSCHNRHSQLLTSPTAADVTTAADVMATVDVTAADDVMTAADITRSCRHQSQLLTSQQLLTSLATADVTLTSLRLVGRVSAGGGGAG